jgi:predicted transcriptional regulator
MAKSSSRARKGGGRVLEVGVGDLDGMTRRFADAWRAAERGAAAGPAQERLLFSDLPTLLRALTPRRWTMLRELRRLGPSSVRALAKAQKRDYKTVHTDVREMERLGLIEREVDGRVSVPWSRVAADIDLAA